MASKNKHVKILSIKPGTRFLSVAVFEDYDLICWQNKIIKNGKMSASKTLKKFRFILEDLIEFWNPDLIAAEEVFFGQSKKSKLLASAVEEIKKICKEKGVKLLFYPPLSVRKYICGEEKPNKMNTARIIAMEYYSWLTKNYEKENKKKWYEVKNGLRIFDAVAVGLFCLSKLKINNK